MLVLTLAGCGGDGGKGDAKPAATTAPAAPAAPVKDAASSPAPARVLKLADDTAQARAGKRIAVAVLGNDQVTLEAGESHDLDTEFGDTDLTVTVSRPAGHGTAVVEGTSVVYTPTGGYGGEDEFTYRVNVKGEPPLTGTAVVRITVAGPSPTPSPTPKATHSARPKVYYRNCTAARAAGAAPVRVGDPGYGPWLDRDGDGIGCESGGSSGGGGSTGGSSGGSSGGGGGGSTYYKNCAAVRAAGAAPIHVGDPGYGRHLDRDGDGVGCE
ncbi:hypothetical protein GCM10009612_19560 [Streptomyces beijiangensis]